ncbi:MAG: alcohol dehydrogenase catalytic domain-containing protein [Deltaproteobacteria bacterium]|nr:alcohol dehydrogenase catalytic domain-containing protein [Deltaproteobacteria bacterium]
MRAAVYYRNSFVRIEERPVPEIGPGELLVRISASGICGSDVMEWYRVRKAPIVLGHEVSGVVERAGEGVTAFSPGDRVVVSHHVPCMTCALCRDGKHTLCDTLRSTSFDPGGFCEYVRVPALQTRIGTFRLPDALSFEEGTFVEPLACVLRGMRIAGMREGRSVVVLGSGLSGLLHVKAARMLGASFVATTDVDEGRLAAAMRFGADAAWSARDDVPGLLRAALGGKGADLVFVTTAALPAYAQAVRCFARGGVLVMFGLPDPGAVAPFPIHDLWMEGVTITSTYAGAPDDFRAAIEALASRRITVTDMISHRLPLEEAQKGFELVAGAKGALKVILFPNGVP